MTNSERESIRSMFGGRCAYCGKKLGKSFHVDHVEPMMRHLPGADERSKIYGEASAAITAALNG